LTQEIIPRGWKRVPISETWEGLFDGPHATPAPAAEGPVFLGIKNVTDDGHLDLSDVRHISELDYPNWTKRVEPRAGDIVFTYEATLNRYAIIPNGFRGCLGRRLALIRPDKKKVDTRFLFYSFFGADWRNTIEHNRLAGATVDRIPIAKFPGFPINLPPLPIQRRIADFLSAYDDLIEVNTRRIAILEEMARRLFDEWFVRFRYPASATDTFIDSALGPLPSRWSAVPLSNYCEKITDGSHWSPTSVPDGKLMASVKDMREWGFDLEGCRQISEEDFANLVRNDCQPKAGDILVAKDGANLNKHTFLVTKNIDAVVLSSIAIIRPKPTVPSEFLVALLKSSEVSDRIKRSVSGAAIPRIILKDFKRLAVVLPPEELQRAWAKAAGPMHQLCRELSAANDSLRAARQLLLPKMISGEIELDDATNNTDLAVAQVAAA